MQVFPGVYLVNGFPYMKHQNGYVVRTDHAAFMIDSGDMRDESFATVEAASCMWNIELSELSHLLVTHPHFDHSSHAARLRELGLRVVASAQTAEAMAAGDDRCIGYNMGKTFDPCHTDDIVEDAQTFSIGDVDVRCIAAPGHEDGCMIYELILNGQRLWFAGDVVLTEWECEGATPGWEGGPGYDRKTYLETLRGLAHRDCDCLFPGHGPPCIGRGRRMVEMAFTKAMVEWR